MNQKILVKRFSWSRYRFRLFKSHIDVPRDFSGYRKICFLHRVEQSLCHCKMGEYHFEISPKIAIPPKKDKKAWAKLEQRLKTLGDHPEVNTSICEIKPVMKISKDDRLKLKLLGIIPNIRFNW